MNNLNLKIAIEELKKEVASLNYYVNHIVSLPKDKKSFKNLVSAQLSAIHIDRIVKKDIGSIEKTIQSNIEKETHEKFRQRLANINTPNTKMKKTANDFLDSTTSPNTLIKKAISEQIKKASSDGKQSKSAMGDR